MDEIRKQAREVEGAVKRLESMMKEKLVSQDIPINLKKVLDNMQYLLGYITCMENNGVK
ncbi:MAG: hypothetical protein FWC00_03290 [Firmicutes bacterium]|nr:hypothetical protein [Bacillota bacterium]